jgi:hypothetical protein
MDETTERDNLDGWWFEEMHGRTRQFEWTKIRRIAIKNETIESTNIRWIALKNETFWIDEDWMNWKRKRSDWNWWRFDELHSRMKRFELTKIRWIALKNEMIWTDEGSMEWKRKWEDWKWRLGPNNNAEQDSSICEQVTNRPRQQNSLNRRSPPQLRGFRRQNWLLCFGHGEEDWSNASKMRETTLSKAFRLVLSI